VSPVDASSFRVSVKGDHFEVGPARPSEFFDSPSTTREHGGRLVVDIETLLSTRSC
jgi:hypothetical protein